MNKFKGSIFLLICVSFIASCGGGSESAAPVPDSQPENNLSTPACSNYSAIENTQMCSFVHNELTREFYIYIPNGYSENIAPVPVLFSLHGGGDYAETNMQYSGFKEHADADTFIIIYPQGSYYDGKETTGWNTEDGGVDDVAFLESVIDWVGNNYNTQLKEFYVAGFSNGGFMAYHLACYSSADFAAIAPVAGLMGNYTYDTCSPLHPTPLIHIHGQQDDIISINGSDYHRPLEDNGNTTGVITYWQNYNQCETYSQELLYEDEVNIGTFNEWADCASGADINYWIMFDQGHEWNESDNGNDDKSDKGQSNNFDTSQTIWNFLKDFDIDGIKAASD